MGMLFNPVTLTPVVNSGFPVNCTFREAAESYIKHGGRGQYLGKIIDRIGIFPLTAIYPFDVEELAKDLYPLQKNSTRNRCAITPIRVVFHHAYKRGWGPLIKISNFKQEPPPVRVAANELWIDLFIRQCDRDGLPHLAAIVLFMCQTGARVSEAVRLRWPELNLMERTALLLRTKTKTNSRRFLTSRMVRRFHELEKTACPDDPVFRYTCRHSVNERIKAVCERAEIEYKSSHVCGRHAYANIAMALGLDIKSVMEQGGWESIDVFMGTYVRSRNNGRSVAERFDSHRTDNDF